MTISFPTSLDALTNPAGSDSLTGHALQHANVNDAIEALEAKVGVNSSADTSSLDYKVAHAIQSSEKGAVSGVAPLGLDSKVPSAYLPSYVDDVVEVANYAALPVTGEAGKIYVVIADETHSGSTTQYRWSGSAYSIITSSPGSTDAVPEGTTNLYFTAQRVRDAVLTGLSLASSAVVSATDSVLSAIGKLQAQVSGKQDTLVSGTNIKTINGSSVLGSGDLAVSGGGQVVQSTLTTLATGTALIPSDDTIPQNTEGDQYLSVTITPKSATSTLVIDVEAEVVHSAAASYCVGALFQDSTANALAVGQIYAYNTSQQRLKFSHQMTSGTTVATTFKVRAGGTVAGTLYINGIGGSRYFGGAMYSLIRITEIPA